VKVVHVGLEATATRPGGLNRYFEDLVRAERGIGLDATGVVLARAPSPPGEPGFVVAGSDRDPLLRRLFGIDRAVRRLGRPDVADVHFAGTAAFSTSVGALRRVPIVAHFQGPWADESSLAGAPRLNVSAKRAIERQVYRRVDRFVVLSAAFGELLSTRYGVAPWSIEVLPPGVDLERFTPGGRADARDLLGVESDHVALAVRRLVPRMGLECLLHAWRRLEPGDAELLAIVGEGPERAALAELASSLGIASSVRFCGRVDDGELVAWYRAADITVVPSVALEGFGLVVLESAACATPVVGSDVDGLREALDSVGCGPGLPVGDDVALAGALASAFRSGATPSAVELRAAASAHGWSAVATRHATLYDEVCSGVHTRRVVVLDHTAVLSGGELALARALGGVGRDARIHALLATDGPFRRQLEATGATVEVLALDERTRSVRRGSVRPSRLDPRAVMATARYVVRLAWRLRQLRPDVVHTNSLKAALYGGAAARLAGIPCVWHLRDRIDSSQLPVIAVRSVQIAARLLPTVVVANSDSTLATVRVAVGRVIPSPLDPSIFAPTRSFDRSAPLRITVLGRLAPWKGQDLALEAFAAVLKDTPATLWIVGAALFGEDDYAASLPKLAEHLGIAAQVRFEGFVDDVAGVLADTDVVVHSSRDPEPFGQVVLEAMGAGCAVLVADQGGPASLVTDGVDGLHYAMGDTDALASALRRVSDDASLRQRLGSAATGTAARFTPEALAPRLLEAWEAAIARTPVRRARRRRETVAR
jgi:glycosyltransferase involved in cell wall biosynthesis